MQAKATKAAELLESLGRQLKTARELAQEEATAFNEYLK
jgi:hypothetical protein